MGRGCDKGSSACNQRDDIAMESDTRVACCRASEVLLLALQPVAS